VDAVGHRRESVLLASFLVYIYEHLQPRRRNDPAAKPASALSVLQSVRRVHRHHAGVDMVRTPLVKAALTGLLREFVRQVARSKAFRRRYWSGLYITKAIEVMHRRILGRPSFGRWEIDAYFDTAARSGFYGVIDKMLNSREYNDCFGEDTVPYERFITAGDRNARRVPGLNRPFNASAYVDLTPGKRPNVAPPKTLRTSGDLVDRNLAGRRQIVVGGWTAQIAGGETAAAPKTPTSMGPGSIRQLPTPSRRWTQAPITSTGFWSVPGRTGSPDPTTRPQIVGNWQASVGSERATGQGDQARPSPGIQPPPEPGPPGAAGPHQQ